MWCFFKSFPFITGMILCFLVACSSSNTVTEVSSVAGDYLFQSDEDTISMSLKQEKDSVYGDLKYAFSGKDKNIGKINGSLKDSIITAEYNFISEGIPSVRQIVFKLTDEGLIEGYGAIEESNGKMIFSDKSNLSFDHGMVLKKR
ncbi:hypothetical protein SAMN05660841_00065 [Sphingobacterium nematocida]|uniref:Uncharacterized protein n=2 Tax=Sphingobacterium nematocida TaxID=1513896 RepID=A0A1T5AQ55_9SPHI|nr:hypothetical protein SAMN05660841_00065 [Sphingobacterium nematocida]